MNAGLYGLIAALGWGSAEILARFSGRAIGPQQALFGMTAVGVVALSLTVWGLDLPILWDTAGIWLLLISGIGITYSTMLLYEALSRGPVSIVAPIVGSYPVFNMALAIILGARPGLLQWAAIISVLAGIWVVSYASGHFLSEPEYTRTHLRRTILLSLCASLGFGISIAASQEATRYFGELQTICLSRWIGLSALSLYFIYRHRTPTAVLSCWPILSLQGLLDTCGYVTLMLAAQTKDAEIAVVTSSGFCVVTLLLARCFLHERISLSQWGGVILIVSGVAVLSAGN